MSKISYPLQHLSIRVPWHDNGWNGTVCKSPKFNTSCLKLKGIADSKQEEAEESVAGQAVPELLSHGLPLPPCVKERATFMADFDFDRVTEHPYTKNNSSTHGHFRPTVLRYPAYSAAAVPFRWMMRDEVFGNPKKKETVPKIERYPLEGVDPAFEPTEDDMGFKTNWMQDYRNHTALLECFWNHVQVQDSLVFFYAKQVPLVEDTGKRVLIGVGRVKHLGKSNEDRFTEYNYDGDPGDRLRSMLWECMVTHSIRPDFSDGFLLPYHEAMEKSDEGRAFDPVDVVAFAPDDRFNEFSYGTEHVGNDAAISALLSIRDSLNRSAELFGFASDRYEAWVDRELGRLWKKRGPFPGLGALLCATGVSMGNFVAQALVDKVGDKEDPWPAWFETLDDPKANLPNELARHVDKTIAKAWNGMGEERRAFLHLLSRLDLSQDQAGILVSPEAREEYGISLGDEDIVSNPYLIYESTRLTAEPVAIGVVDRGLFPNAMIRNKFPIPEPSQVKTAVDARRLRALAIRNLELASGNGDTLRQRDDVIRDLRKQDGDDEQKAQVTADLMAVAEDELFKNEIRIVEMANGRPAYQLERLGLAGDLIRRTVEKRIGGERHNFKVDWRKALDSFLEDNGVSLPEDSDEREREEQARAEKTAALEELAASRFSVLIGRAGTGKTTLLSVLCAQPQIGKDGVLLLAPTGKARVRMEDVARRAGIKNSQAFTLAQHLSATDRYDGWTQRYLMTGKRGDRVAKTVIVDECSMLTEEMMAALIESLTKVDRLIFVGDYRQLPPIGAGRPFIDIVARLQPDDFPADQPHVSAGFAELMIPRRQGAGERDDLLLASWFGGGETSAGDDQVFEILSGKRKSETVQFVTWETPDELEKELPKVLSDSLGFDTNTEERQAFGLSLGGNEYEGSIWYGTKYKNREGSGVAAEAWQILSPVRQKPWGVETLNRLIHTRYKESMIEYARRSVPKSRRSIPKPMGEHQLVYGDKVINNRNQRVFKSRMYPKPPQGGYLANGEIGIAVGHRRTWKKNWDPDYLEIEFSTQRGTGFKFYNSDFKEEGEASLELAYALTVHKAQGSEFKTVFLVLPRSPLMVTRELLYTALTRQKEKVVVLLQGSATDLHRFSSERYSAAACRLTNLFGPPNPVEVKGAFLEERLIHNTTRGEPVRSKSEVIIANLLHAKGIDYDYEVELVLDGESQNKFPDFTIEDDDSGKTYFWEHLGMLGDSGYKQRWQEKAQWYRNHGILPFEEGGGPNGALITTRDDPKGGIDSSYINQLIDKVFGN
ncbi:MAG: RNA helicase [Gimesia sp.]|nr:RNA helicase [Gimesia sp.]